MLVELDSDKRRDDEQRYVLCVGRLEVPRDWNPTSLIYIYIFILHGWLGPFRVWTAFTTSLSTLYDVD